MKNYILKVENEDFLASVSNLFRLMLDKKIIDLILVPQETPQGKCVVQTLVGEASKVVTANPFAPVLLGNSAKLVSDLTFRSENKKIGVVLRPCEVRALVELVKLKQIDKKPLFIISVDCLGTYEVDDYKNNRQELRHACQACEYPRSKLYDMNIGFIGCDIKSEIMIKLGEQHEGIAKELLLNQFDGEDKSEGAVKELKEKRIKFKESLFKTLKENIREISGLLDILSTCKKCFNCQRACPICYCKECIMCGSTFQYQMRDYLKSVNRAGVIKMPVDTLLFHLTRLNHMSTSCIACGQCTSACPSKIQIADIFNMIGAKTQAIFNYTPGENFEDELPQATFREDELNEK